MLRIPPDIATESVSVSMSEEFSMNSEKIWAGGRENISPAESLYVRSCLLKSHRPPQQIQTLLGSTLTGRYRSEPLEMTYAV